MRVGVSLERKRELVSEHVTLDGKPAIIRGWRQRFATVSALDGSTGQIEWAWDTVAHIVSSRGGAFLTAANGRKQEEAA